MNDEIPSINLGEESQGDTLAFFQNIIHNALADEGIELDDDQIRDMARSTLTGLTEFIEQIEENNDNSTD